MADIARAPIATLRYWRPLNSEQIKIDIQFTYKIRPAITIESQPANVRNPFAHGDIQRCQMAADAYDF